MTTNLERIRQMTADELAEFFHPYIFSICILGKEYFKQWLENKVEE